MINNLPAFNFTIAFQLAYFYNIEELRNACLEYLEKHGFTEIFDLDEIQRHFIKNTPDKPPTNILLLDENCFKSLLKLNISYKHLTNTISYMLLFKVMKLYVEKRSAV